MDIPKTTEALCNMLKESIITLLRAYKDTSIDVEHLRIFPDNQSSAFDSSDDEIDIFNSRFFSLALHKRLYLFL